MKYLHSFYIVATVFFLFANSPTVHANLDVSENAPHNEALTLFVDDLVEKIDHETYDLWTDHTPYLTLDQKYTSELENSSFCPTAKMPCFLRMTERDFSHIKKDEIIIAASDLLEEFLDEASSRLLREPVDAELAISNDAIFVTSLHQDGFSLPPEENIEIIVNALESGDREIMLTVTPKLAKIRSDNYEEELGLKELIGEGRSDFTGSSAARIHNIKTAASKFDNMIIAPGEEFSFVANLGAVDGTTGYKKELVIKDNQTKPEYGGGVCQVSTTIFRGAILTGMEITERRNHSYPVKYYKPFGFDATIYLPAPDIKFKNNTEHHIMIHSEMQGSELVFKYFGTKDGRKVVMDGPHITEQNPDGSMKTYFTQKVNDEAGNQVFEKTFYSNYKSPNAYPRVGDTSIGGSAITSKPKDWSKKQWKEYKKANGL